MRVSAAYSRLLQAELKSAIIKKNKLERENAALREWIEEEGERTDVCTYHILGRKICSYCQCGRKEKAK